MKSINNYILQQSPDFGYDINYINESLENNVHIINEAKLITEHGKDIDNLLYKFKTYTYNNLYNTNSLNESDNTYKLSLNEQQTFRDLMIFICEDYRDKLLEELNIYESLIIDGQLITEGKFIDKLKNKSKNLVANIKQTWELGKDKVKQAIEVIKTKIKEVNELIKEYATKAITSVKEMASKLVSLLVKFDCTLEGLFEKMGFDTEKEAESVNNISKEISANPDYIKKNDVYESYANSLNIINEDENSKEGQGDQNIKDKGETQQQAEKKSVKDMLWQGFKQLMIWAGVCVVIPGFVCAFFPGTFIALIVPIACKLLWNAYKIKKLVQQWKKIRKEKDNYTKRQKIFTYGGMILSIVAIIWNFDSAFDSLGKVLGALTKSGGDLFAQANLGIQPDVLTRGFAAIVNMIKEGKFSFEDFQASFKAITDSFAEHIPGGEAVKYTGHIGQDANKVLQKFTDGNYKSSWDALKDVMKSSIKPEDVSKIPDDSMVDLVVNGSPDSVYGKALKSLMKASKVVSDPDNAVNQSLRAIKKLAGSAYSVRVPKDVALEILKNGAKYAKDGAVYAVGAATEITTISGPDIINAATSMLVTIPSVEVAPQNNGGFRVRLGGKKDKNNFVYEVGKDGVKKHKVSDYQKEYDKIKSKVAEVNKKFLEDLLKNDKLSDEDKNKIEKDLKEFESNYKEKINTEDCIVFYGTRYKEEKTNESFRSLYDYIINEAETSKYSIDDIKQNFIDLKNLYLTKIGNENNKVTKDQKKGDFKGNTQMILGSIFTLNDKYKTSKFKWDENYKPTPYELVKQRANDNDKTNDVFGPEDIELLAVHYCIWHGPDNEETYKAYVKAFIDAAILKGQFMNNENEDIIIASYKRLIDNLLKIESIANDVKDKEWQPKEEWAPIKIDEDDIDSKTLKKVKDTENNDDIETSKKKAEDELEDTNAPLPAEQDNKDNSSDNSKEENDKTDESDGKEIPVLMLANNYGIDLASATKSGPRKDAYALKGIFDSLTFSTFEGGTSVDNITKMLGDILHAQTNNLMSVSANRPCNKDKNDNKFILNDKLNKGDEERPDFGMLTNQEITDILNKPENAVKLIKGKSSKYTIAQTEEDKKLQDKKKNEFKGKLENPDEETVKLVKEIDPELVDDNGKIKDTDKLSDTLSNYYLAKDKAKDAKKSGGGLFSKIKNFVKGLFGGDKDEGKKYNSLLNHFEESLYDNDNLINEKLKENNEFLNECFKRMSLSEYIRNIND